MSRLFELVPKDPLENLEYRQYVFDKCLDDPDYRDKMRMNCSLDCTFWINTFCWVYEPRKAQNLPFITFPFQDDMIEQCNEHLGVKDIACEKSRDMGASWIFLSVFFHRWLYHPKTAWGLVSRNEALVDKTGDPDTLMWKLDHHIRTLPKWMIPDHSRQNLMLTNNDNGSTIAGYSATGDVGRGGRKTGFLMDEIAAFATEDGYDAWASTSRTTQSRIALSTPKGATGVFYDIVHDPDAALEKMTMHWTQHPYYNRGLYWWEGKKLKRPDKTYRYPDQRKYAYLKSDRSRKFRERSAWYDNECRRNPVPALIAQELDIDYGGAGSPFFESSIVDKHIRKHASKHRLRGSLDWNTEDFTPDFFESRNGSLIMWCAIRADGTPSVRDDFVIGCDIATGKGGTYSTNSVASVVNQRSGEKVAELATNIMLPTDFAEQIAALRIWFRGPRGLPFLVFEKNGPGETFAKRIQEIQPQRIYRRRKETGLKRKKLDEIGWWTDQRSKLTLLSRYQRALRDGDFKNHHKAALEETKHYVYLPTGQIEHDRAMAAGAQDPTAAKANHGDRVIADALACHGILTEHPISEEKKSHKPPYGSFAWRRQQSARDAKANAKNSYQF